MTLDQLVDLGIKLAAGIGGPYAVVRAARLWLSGRGRDARAEVDLAAAVRRIAAEEISYARSEAAAARLEAAAARSEVAALRASWSTWYRVLVTRWEQLRHEPQPPPPPH